ncbi:hypothetical protein QG516_00465 [Pedobacter gandavensis]|uniref:hypothetical protein n=1 Tax=Pedobacter gandavensis TaxID=2679963 RepID=UPI0024799B28|nr:hypothetical protein [Pedobacter gandavensis]WGQ10126.1 hypothetical protein QG516_00465 [Pedobacter gandavensis]
MKFVLKKYQELFSKELTSKVAKTVVRECDEIGKDRFQAYVDERDQTFDTEIVFDTKGDMVSNSCDCPAATLFCNHKAALLLYLINGKRKSSAIRITKINPLESLVQQADPDQLKVWLLELFSKNKDLALAFTQKFSVKQEAYSVEDLRNLSFDAVKAVVSNRKVVEIAEVKRIIGLWETLHESIIDDYLQRIGDEDAFLRFDAILDVVNEIKYNLKTNSNRIETYHKGILSKVIPLVHQITEEAYWDKVVNFFIARIHVDLLHIRNYYLSFLVQLYSLSEEERKHKLALNLLTQYIGLSGQKFQHKEDYVAVVFNMVVDCGLFELHYLLFKPMHNKNDYNYLLIGLLIKEGHLLLAEKYCLEQIANNCVSDYNKSYLKFLAEIYSRLEDNQKLAMVLKETFAWSFDFDAYSFVSKHIVESQEKKKWRINLLSRARRLAADQPGATLFWFQLLDEEGRYEKMLDYLDSTVTYEVIIRFAEKMSLKYHTVFFTRLIHKRDHPEDQMAGKQLTPVLNQLMVIMRKLYSPQELQLAIKHVRRNAYYASPNLFVLYMETQL